MDEQAAAKAGIKLALHLEPYDGRSVESVRLDLRHIHRLFLDPEGANFHLRTSLLTTACACNPENICPVIFVYDSYRLHPSDWQQLLGQDGGLRCSTNDVFAIALWLDSDGGEQVSTASKRGV
jgi:glycoprotein endo-alpha-1,2-mannosidase